MVEAALKVAVRAETFFPVPAKIIELIGFVHEEHSREAGEDRVSEWRRDRELHPEEYYLPHEIPGVLRELAKQVGFKLKQDGGQGNGHEFGLVKDSGDPNRGGDQGADSLGEGRDGGADRLGVQDGRAVGEEIEGEAGVHREDGQGGGAAPGDGAGDLGAGGEDPLGGEAPDLWDDLREVLI